jgi:hypothetical protein
MKHILFAILFLLANSSAFAFELPAHWCDREDSKCSAQQISIWNKFFDSKTTLLEQSAPGLFTGSCYFKSYYQNPEREAFGVTVFDRKQNEAGEHVFFGGQFGEFFEKNPWADLTLAEALKQGLVRYDDRFKVNILPDRGELNVSDSKEHFIYYWFRQSESGDKLYLLGQGDGTVLSFCELNRRP